MYGNSAAKLGLMQQNSILPRIEVCSILKGTDQACQFQASENSLY